MEHHELSCKRKMGENKMSYLYKKVFSRETHLRRHLKLHAEGKYKITFNCTMCKKVLKYKISFEKHLKQCCSGFSKLDSFATMASNEKYSSEVYSCAEFNDSNQSLIVVTNVSMVLCCR